MRCPKELPIVFAWMRSTTNKYQPKQWNVTLSFEKDIDPSILFSSIKTLDVLYYDTFVRLQTTTKFPWLELCSGKYIPNLLWQVPANWTIKTRIDKFCFVNLFLMLGRMQLWHPIYTWFKTFSFVLNERASYSSLIRNINWKYPKFNIFNHWPSIPYEAFHSFQLW